MVRTASDFNDSKGARDRKLACPVSPLEPLGEVVNASSNIKREIVRFPSLTFVEGARGEQNGNTTIKNAKLRSEMIVDDTTSQISQDQHLFENSRLTYADTGLDSVLNDSDGVGQSLTVHKRDGGRKIIFPLTITPSTSATVATSLTSSSVSMIPGTPASTTGDTVTDVMEDTHTVTESRRSSMNTRLLPTNAALIPPSEDAASSTYQSLTYQTSNRKRLDNSEGESFIYHDAVSVGTTTNPEPFSLGLRHSRLPSKLSYPAESDAVDAASSSNFFSRSPTNQKKFLSDEASGFQSQMSTSPSTSIHGSHGPLPSPSAPRARRTTAVSQVRQVSQRLFSNTNNYTHSMVADDSTSATLYRTSIRRSSGVNDIKPRVFLSPIDDYGFDENEELSDAESLLSRPFRKVGYSIISRRESDQSDRYGSMNVLRDGEHLDPQYYYNSPHDFKSIYYRQNMMLKLLTNTLYMLIGLAVAFVTTRLVVLQNCDDSLSDFTITSLDNILMSDELLLFEVTASSRNTNLQDVSIWNMAVDVFLRTDSSLLESPPIISSVSNDIAILLGNSTTFVTPLNFQGILTSEEGVVNGTFTSLPGEIWHRLTHKSEIRPHLSSGQVKIQHPGRNFRYEGEPLSSDQWSRILNSKYNLIVRGSFNYHLPLMPNNNVVSVATEVEVKPEK